MKQKCYRTVCNNSHDNCKHTQMGTLYCEQCAIRINRANPEVPHLVFIPRKFVVNSEVEVTPEENDLFDHEFVGRISGVKSDECLVTVVDQDDNAWDVLPRQLKLLKLAPLPETE